MSSDKPKISDSDCIAKQQVGITGLEINAQLLEFLRSERSENNMKVSKLDDRVTQNEKDHATLRVDVVNLDKKVDEGFKAASAASKENSENLQNHVIKPLKRMSKALAMAGGAWIVSSITGWSMNDIIKYIASIWA